MIEPMQLLPLLPATAAELIEQTGRSHESVYTELVHLEGQGMAMVQPVHCGGVLVEMEWSRIGEDAPEPPAKGTTRQPSAGWPRSQQALSIIEASVGGVTRAKMAEEMGCKPRTVAMYCKALRLAGLARATGIGRRSVWVAA
jgi:DNA-binding IclR family transcriptional regulator